MEPDLPLAVVTGTSRGVGAACALLLAARGFHVLGVDLEEGSNVHEHVHVDVSEGDCDEVVCQAVGDRPVAALVNNAAVAVYARVEDTTIEMWDRVIDTNLRGPFLLSKALFPSLRAARGSIVNVASVHADATSVGIAAYAASKGGLQALTRALALEGAPEIRVNCVLPGATDTPMLREGLSRDGSTVESLGERHPLGQVAEPQEIAEAIAFLVGDTSSVRDRRQPQGRRRCAGTSQHRMSATRL